MLCTYSVVIEIRFLLNLPVIFFILLQYRDVLSTSLSMIFCMHIFSRGGGGGGCVFLTILCNRPALRGKGGRGNVTTPHPFPLFRLRHCSSYHIMLCRFFNALKIFHFMRH